MKIDNGKGIQLANLYQRQQLEEKQGGAQKAAANKTAADSLAISGDAAKMRELLQTAAQPPEVNTARIEELKNAIARGEYLTDSKKISAAMLAALE
ncbi:MAG: flagellar biosynthesis anti-sigma factor FlgM [Firmicutes bacterium]|nr:flagellar biosynthesis anti-sigma factor FlgM [Dethiobacter sp.]MBS3899650.1 flagellar biosynthesis anti-sigma factor FlgM [Dethiobacter sp.]MCL4463802.1 flagellar biosynthesis anti-sigma factor FlgM [Bacillota bacterium]MCL5994379.1 flagellar biosynthesis anti-sigma factor FlgM [Bacillota bacterium]